MKSRLLIAIIICLLKVTPFLDGAEEHEVLLLKDAEEVALKNHPRITAADLNALVAEQETRQVRSAFFPTVSANLTAVGTSKDSRIGAGGLNNPSIFSREANGIVVNQMLSDFGRTANLLESSKLQAHAEQENALATRAQILLEVDKEYFRALQAQSVLRVATETVEARKAFRDLTSALAKSQLKSNLDASFANVNFAQAKLLFLRADNSLNAAFAGLATVLGMRQIDNVELHEESLPDAPVEDFASLVVIALSNRPELARLRDDRDAALKFVQAEKALRYPTVSMLGAAGITPIRDTDADKKWNETYAVAGINIGLPILDGGRISARQQEAKLKAEVTSQFLTEAENEIVRDLKLSWLDAHTSYETIHVTEQLLEQATQSLKLADLRYHLGTSSIVELTQAQLNETEAAIANATAKYQYEIENSNLQYQLGTYPGEEPKK